MWLRKDQQSSGQGWQEEEQMGQPSGFGVDMMTGMLTGQWTETSNRQLEMQRKSSEESWVGEPSLESSRMWMRFFQRKFRELELHETF